MRWPWSKQKSPAEVLVEPPVAAPIERRASGSGFTSEIIAARESYISGRRGIGELTATVQACLSLWEGGLSLADVTGTDLLPPSVLSLLARSLGLRGEAVFWIEGERLVPAADWDIATRDGAPIAYNLTVADTGGGRRVTVLAAEVLHVRLAADVSAPWTGPSAAPAGIDHGGPLARNQRHLAQWTLQPVAALVAQEASEKLGQDVNIDVMRPLQAFDAGGRARALATIVEALARAKEAGLSPGDVGQALSLVDWQE